MNQYFLQAFEGMERLSPGSEGTTLYATKTITRNEELNILEIGGGVGTSALLLAKAFPKARIISIDNNKDYIRQLNQKASQVGLAKQVQGMVMSVKKMEFPAGQFDVIFAEGSVYLTGMERALKEWKKFLKPDGQIILNDLCWLKPHVSKEVLSYWQEQYPQMDSVRNHMELMKKSGYEVRGTIVQQRADWVEHYYKPIQDNLTRIAKEHGTKKDAKEVLAHFEKEMDMYFRFASCYSYVYFVLKREAL